MTTWTKYSFACDPDECDTLIEVTCRDFGFPNGVTQLTCPCGRNMNYLSVVDATIQPTETKEEKMEDTTTIGSDALHSSAVEYNPNLLVTYKVIHGYSDPEYTTAKVSSLEWDLHNGRQAQKTNGVYESKVNTVKDIILEAFADSDDQDTLRAIAEALNIELTRTVEFSATMYVTGSIEVDLLDDFDLESELSDQLQVSAWGGHIEVEDYHVEDARES